MYVEDSNILFIGTSTTIHVSRPTKPPEKQRLRLAQAVTLPHGTAAVSLPEPFPARLVLAAVAQQRASCRPWMWCFIPSSLGGVSEAAGGHPGSGHAAILYCAESATGGQPLRRAPRVPRPQCPTPCRAGWRGRGGAGSPPPCREVTAAGGGSGGCSRCAGAGPCWRQASNGAAGLGVRAAPSFSAAFPARPARPLPLREAMLRPPPRPRRRRQVTAPRVARPCPGAALCPGGAAAAPRGSPSLVTARRGSAVTGCGEAGFGPVPGDPAVTRGGCTGRAPCVVGHCPGGASSHGRQR